MLAIALAVALGAGQGARAATPSSAEAYEKARRLYFALKDSPEKQRFRHNWVRVIGAFRAIHERYAVSDEAPRAAYTAAELWRGLHQVSQVQDDLEQALLAYARVVELSGAKADAQGGLADDAVLAQAQILVARGERDRAAALLRTLLERYPQGDQVAAAKRLLAELPAAPAPVVHPVRPSREAGAKDPPVSAPSAETPAADDPTSDVQLAGRQSAGGLARIESIETWNNDGYTRFAINVSARVRARSGLAPASGDRPRRLYVDLTRATLAEGLATPTVTDERVRGLRVARYTPETVRVVLDLAAECSHRVLEMDSPRRIVLDVFGPPPATPEPPPVAPPVARGPRRVVIDPGHGGRDHGASGPKGLREKDVALEIAKAVAKKLSADGVQVTLTRDQDVTMPLEARTALANQKEAEVFVSIHANANRKPSAQGIETYYLDVTDDHYALRLAAVENQTGEEEVSELQLILTDLSTKAHTQESMRLAGRLQTALVEAARTQHPSARDLGAKGSLFYVLLGARMPAVLVETSFLTNPEEGKLLGQMSYRDALAGAIAAAVREHLAMPAPTGE